ncbi:hypothetical protein L1987_20297 [Smallanthus sonchifolius]|uniref:Uncharacterized protein n=1 Tax=Smallanthus sonchifolius TaxID=185202 RepID=A0ACB9IRN0_9ASTR|nr:hypothetical protein L1987_20297 [Smallanthus sonchifolius]
MALAFTNEFNMLANTQPEWKGAALQYHEIVDFLNRSRISYAISVDPIVSRTYLEQFWETAEHDCTVTPNVIWATVAGHDIAFSEDTIRRVLQFRYLSTDPTAYPDYFLDGCWRQRMGNVRARDYASYKKMWVVNQWRYFDHVIIMCISSRKAGKDAMGHDLAAAMVGLSLNKGYNFSCYIFKAINDQINTAERFRGEISSEKGGKEVFAQFLKPGSVDPTPEHTALFGHLINEAYVAPGDWIWYSHDSEPELSEHSDEQQQQQEEEDESEDGSSDNGDEEGRHDGAEGSDSEETESDSSDFDDAPSQAHPWRTTKVTLPESSSKRKRQASSSEYEPDSDSDAAIQRQRRESIHKNRGDRQQQHIPSEVVVSPQQQVQVSAVSSDSASTPPSQQLYRRRRRPQVQPDVAVTSVTEEVPAIVTLPITSAQVALTTPILTESVTITPCITPTTVITSTSPTTTIEPLSQPFNYGEFTQGFDFDTIFSSPIHNAEASSSRPPDPNDARIDVLETQVAGLLETIRKSKEESDTQQAQINSLVDEVRILRSQRMGTKERLKNVMAQNELLIRTNEIIMGHRSSLELRFDTQQKEHELMVKLIADLTKKLDAQGEKEKEKEKTTGDEACHPVDLTKDDNKDKDPEAGPCGGEHQALAIMPISANPMAQGESTHQEGGDTSGGGDKGKSVADVLKDLSDDETLYLEPDYSKEAQIDALFNLEEGEIDSGDDWDEDDEDVVIEVPKGDGEGDYELEDGEIFEFPSFEAQLDTGSVEHASNVEASTEASPVDPTPVDPKAPKEKDMPSTSSKGPAPVWQKTSIIDKQGATGMILAVRFEEDKQLFAIKRSGGVQYLKPTREAFKSLPKYDLVNLAYRELLGHSNHAVAMGLWVVLQREARSGKFEVFKPQGPKRVKDKTARHPVTKKFLKKLVYKPVLCETKIPLSRLSQDILGDMWYWYVDPKTGEAVVIGKVRSEKGCLVPRELIRVFDEFCFINFFVKDLEALADRYCMHTDEWTKFLASKYDKVIKFCLDYKKKMEAKYA